MFTLGKQVSSRNLNSVALPVRMRVFLFFFNVCATSQPLKEEWIKCLSQMLPAVPQMTWLSLGSII